MTNNKTQTIAELEKQFHSLTSRFSKRCVEAQQALTDLSELQSEIDDLKGANSTDGISGALLDHIERITDTNIDDMIASLLDAEQEEAEFIEDGSTPTPPVGFVEEDAPLKVDHDANRRSLAATAKATMDAFRK